VHTGGKGFKGSVQSRVSGDFSCDQIVHVMALSDTYTFASPVLMEVRAEVDWFAQIVIRRKK
jgi:hypothetical protein